MQDIALLMLSGLYGLGLFHPQRPEMRHGNEATTFPFSSILFPEPDYFPAGGKTQRWGTGANIRQEVAGWQEMETGMRAGIPNLLFTFLYFLLPEFSVTRNQIKGLGSVRMPSCSFRVMKYGDRAQADGAVPHSYCFGFSVFGFRLKDLKLSIS